MRSFATFLNESRLLEEDVNEHLEDFIAFVCDRLGIETPPTIELIPEKEHAREARSFGGYSPGRGSICVNIAERHRADVYRTLAHEIVHYWQDLNGRLDENSGETGSDIENEANAFAGIIMREYAKHNPRLFESA